MNELRYNYSTLRCLVNDLPKSHIDIYLLLLELNKLSGEFSKESIARQTKYTVRTISEILTKLRKLNLVTYRASNHKWSALPINLQLPEYEHKKSKLYDLHIKTTQDIALKYSTTEMKMIA